MLAVFRWLFAVIWQSWQEARVKQREQQSQQLNLLEAELERRIGSVSSVAESACLLNMLYHVKLERIMKGL